jgi:hypothetical protein
VNAASVSSSEKYPELQHLLDYVAQIDLKDSFLNTEGVMAKWHISDIVDKINKYGIQAISLIKVKIYTVVLRQLISYLSSQGETVGKHNERGNFLVADESHVNFTKIHNLNSQAIRI